MCYFPVHKRETIKTTSFLFCCLSLFAIYTYSYIYKKKRYQTLNQPMYHANFVTLQIYADNGRWSAIAEGPFHQNICHRVI